MTVLPAPELREEETTLPLHDHFLRVRTLHHLSVAADTRPWLVFLHDSLGCIPLWRNLPAQLALALGCHALVYDRRGYGRSAAMAAERRTVRYLEEEAGQVPRVLAACGIHQAILVGHSDGGTLALLAAATTPALVAAAVTIGAHVFVEDITLAGIRAAEQQYATTDLPTRLARYHGQNTDVMFRAWTATWLHPDFRKWNIETYLPRVTCPVLVLQGVADEYGTPAQVQAIATQVSGPVQAVLLPGLGHTPHRQQPELVLQLLHDFLRPLLT